MTTATEQQMATILARRVDDVAREMMATGVRLSWAQRDEIGDEASDWLRRRLGLTVTTDEAGVTYAAQ